MTTMLDMNAIIATFGDNVKPIHGNLYRVKFDLIQISPPFDNESKTLTFGNPRWVKDSQGQLKAKGLSGHRDDKQSIDCLRDAISQQGLQNPIKLRLQEIGGVWSLMVVDGERRFRSISKLIEDEEEVRDNTDFKIKAAKDAYEFVEARIEIMSEEAALENAIVSSEAGIPLGDPAILNVVIALRKINTDKEIIKKICGNKSETWWRETQAIIDLDEQTLAAYQSEEINRKVATQLAKVNDVEERIERLTKVRESLKQYIEGKKEKLKEKAQKQEQEVEHTEKLLESFKSNNMDLKDIADRVLKAKSSLEETQEEIQDLDEKPATATEKHYNDVAIRTGADDIKPLSFNKIEKFWMADLNDLEAIAAKSSDNLEFDVADVQLLKTIFNVIRTSKKDDEKGKPYSIIKILHEHKANK